MKVDVYVLCYNEERLIPFMLDYWATFATNVYVLDNESTDNSIKLLKNENRFNVEIITYKTNNELNDLKYLELKNNIWKNSIGKCDFVMVCDMDEALFSPNIIEELTYMKHNNMTILFPKIYNMFSNNFPIYEPNKFLHEIVCNGIEYQSFGKRVLFDPNKITEINYQPGAHQCSPVGIINYYDRNKIFLLHYKFLSIQYVLDRYRMYHERMSDINKQYKWGFQYGEESHKTINYFNSEMEKIINVNEIINN